MPRTGKGRKTPQPKPISDDLKEKFQALIDAGKEPELKKQIFINLPSHFVLIPHAVNQLWNWQTLENVSFDAAK